jgi:hypothetical protein
MEKIDVVYILRNNGTRWMDNEIKYSIRALEKNVRFGKLWIVGGCPKFIDKEKIGYIKAEDPYSNKLRNAVHKISLACREQGVSEDFILMNDDFFFLRRVEEIKSFNKGKLSASKKNHSTHGGYYYRAISDTLETLRDMGVQEPIDFEVHYPIVFNKQKFLKTMEKISEEEGILFRSIYGNLNHIESKYRRDVKVFNIDQFRRVKKNDLMSTDEKIVTDNRFQKWIKNAYPYISRFEKAPIIAYTCKEVFEHNGKKYNPGDIILEKISENVIRSAGLKKISKTFY